MNDNAARAKKRDEREGRVHSRTASGVCFFSSDMVLDGGRREGGGGWWFGRGRKDGGEETAARRGEEFEKWTRAGF